MRDPLATDEMTDWADWSRQAVAEMEAQNQAWLDRFSLHHAPYRWDLGSARLTFTRSADSVTADICVVGTVSHSQRTFRWAWANDAVPSIATRGLALVRSFGERHDLAQLVTPEWAGGRAEGLEMLAIAGRIQKASGGLVDEAEDLTLFFTLSRLRVGPWVGTDRPAAG